MELKKLLYAGCKRAALNFAKQGNIDILEKLEEYSKAGYVPMHMPGGKRNTEYASTSELDITEIDGFDNLHAPEEILRR